MYLRLLQRHILIVSAPPSSPGGGVNRRRNFKYNILVVPLVGPRGT
uniref:Uncharacterized protein n=1 Tax=Amphimedon queenslandica TaxID=400682 RepID=A0A1X7UXL7_AMPQE